MQEKTVQKKALDFLEIYYSNRFLRRKIFKAMEVRTKRKYGGKRADGLLVFESKLWGKPYVISLEAKSIKTLPAIKPFQDYRRWLRNSLKMGFAYCLATGLFFMYAQAVYTVSSSIFFAFLILSGLAFGVLTWNNYRHQSMEVISQLKQYPANEQWLAFSKEAFDALTIEKQKLLRQICQSRGIGLLLIQKNSKTTILSSPQKKWLGQWEFRGGLQWISDFLIYYSREKEIRKAI